MALIDELYPIQFPSDLGVLTVYSPDILDPLGAAVIRAYEAAGFEGFNELSETGNPYYAAKAIFDTLQQPLGTFSQTPSPELFDVNATVLTPGLTAPIGWDPIDFILRTVGDFLGAAARNAVESGELEPSQERAAQQSIQDVFTRAQQQQYLATRNQERNPFLSLQAGPFIPCSQDDPKGRCLSPQVQSMMRQRVIAGD